MERSIEVVTPGPLSTVQDLGRVGAQHLGFSPGGAADPYAAATGNRLLQNDPALAVIEITLGGASFRFHNATTIAISGAEASARLDDQPLAPWQTHAVPAGSLLRLGPPTRGVRTYLCVRNGVDVPVVYGSRATDLLAQIGGFEGRALRAGDLLPIGAPDPAPARRLAMVARPLYQRLMLLRVVPGPQEKMFTRLSRDTFFSAPYRVSARADRTGVFLEGPRLYHRGSADILSEGVTAGAIQVPAGAQPLVLLVEHRSVGGYAKIGTVCRADLPRLGQARPGDIVLCVPVAHDVARRAYVALEQLHREALAITEHGSAEHGCFMVEEWLTLVEAAVMATMSDERVPLLLSDLARLAALVAGHEAPERVAQALSLHGEVIAPDAAGPQIAVRAPCNGTLLALPGERRDIPSGASLAMVWSPGACALLMAGHPLTHLAPLRALGARVTAGEVLFEGAFLISPGS